MAAATDVCRDSVILNQWHPLWAIDETEPGVVYVTGLLAESVSFAMTSDGRAVVWRTRGDLAAGTAVDPDSVPDPLPSRCEFLYVWTSLGDPLDRTFDIPEFFEPDRRNFNGSTIGVNVSAPRAVENFLDMGHFPFVHDGVLGSEPHTEVVDYKVAIDAETDEIWATECQFWQPAASATATEGQMVDYVYRVMQPYSILLYKSCPAAPDRMDLIGLFVQPVTEDYVRAHMFLSLVDDESSIARIRYFVQTVFAQDMPILENQNPRLLPLDPQAETPIRSDRASIAYRRWLSDLGITYGVIPAA
ncbi:MAG: aromatic ring-hydroxylating dioxygenase subunit alpha [Acidimicrobiia bacterium]|nr:aromatic ring-hydroxylating dioxygenase subunit alpha [Acidimicrobiia bacterium]